MAGVAHVYVNDIEVGSLPAEQYENIVKQSKRNVWLYVKQIVNLARVTWGLAIYALKSVPWIIFFLFVLASVFVPNDLAQCIDNIKNSNSLELVQVFKSGFSMVYMIICILCGCTIGISDRFGLLGYKSYFDEAISLQIRQILEVPADGRIEVITMKDATHTEEK